MKLINCKMTKLMKMDLTIESEELFDIILRAERQVFEDGLYKNGPTVIKSKLSDFPHDGITSYTVYIPVNEEIENNKDFTYVDQLILPAVAGNRVSMDENFNNTVKDVLAFMNEIKIEQEGDEFYMVLFPVFDNFFVDILIPYKEQ
ncbi:hypothetical protein DIX60_08735 [Streptococcus iniae]|uniref:hypothetical protein n=1 Tax=Streptococcus iniae TaxID=1346 RepID=UPI0008D94543|nr:hypothetical protein [Streptococcus iniae]OHX28286.1 hypothetical protein BKX95_00055 [Streptococcus iniae]RLV27096.1 hypothetical protein DIX60_08735 [Streptococcus iniae]